MSEPLIVYYIGSELYENDLYLDYLRRTLRSGGHLPEEERMYRCADDRLPFVLQEGSRSREGAVHLIFAAPDAYAIVARILATLGEESLRADPDNLHPSSATELSPGRFSYRVGTHTFRVVRAVVGEEMEPPLPPLRSVRRLHLFGREARCSELRRRLESLGPIDCAVPVPGWAVLRIPASLDIDAVLRSSGIGVLHHPCVIEALILYFTARGKSITFAESCTGGLLASRFTSQPGASAILKGSYVTYCNEIKHRWLGVRRETLERFGAVSERCVEEMALGAQRNLSSDLAVAISGIAGPTGAVPGKPVGTVYCCVRNAEDSRTIRLQLHGDRIAIQNQAVAHAIRMVVESEEGFLDFFGKNS